MSIQFEQQTVRELRACAKDLGLPIPKTKKQLVQLLTQHYHDAHKFMHYDYVRQLGHEGKDGRTFLAKHIDTGKEYAVKIFKKEKSPIAIRREARLQQQASEAGLAPAVHDVDGDGRFIVMDVLDTNLFDLFRQQGGTLTVKQQKDVLHLFDQLDAIGIFHQDPNLLNFMYKGKKLYIIDFGMAKTITSAVRSRFGPTPNKNYMPLGFYLKATQIHPQCTLSYIKKVLET